MYVYDVFMLVQLFASHRAHVEFRKQDFRDGCNSADFSINTEGRKVGLWGQCQLDIQNKFQLAKAT